MKAITHLDYLRVQREIAERDLQAAENQLKETRKRYPMNMRMLGDARHDLVRAQLRLSEIEERLRRTEQAA